MPSILKIWTATFLLAGYTAALPVGDVAAAEPTGEWRTASGLANIRIDDCDGVLWGMISWEKEAGVLDLYNPTPTHRNHETLNMHHLFAKKPTKPGLSEDQASNAENG